ncbi:hypothetical protein [Rhodopseudomonas sp. B29]|uniref:hypothetical protein n=1 Tax=Rhodopseudomonas sp. B29 TaxID=95607 RepID=UPI000347A7B4|nr:hypothetical protein [Rhodopseudomonas sp. B29]
MSLRGAVATGLRVGPRLAGVRALFLLDPGHRRGTQALITLNLAREVGAAHVVYL